MTVVGQERLWCCVLALVIGWGANGCGGGGSDLPTASISGPPATATADESELGGSSEGTGSEASEPAALTAMARPAVSGSGGEFVPPSAVAAVGTEPSFPTGTPASDAPNSAEVPAVRVPHPEVLIRTSLGDIHLKLDAIQAPETVDNFLTNYVDRQFYNETVFHFVDPEFIILGGGYTASMEAKEARTPIRNEARNGLKNRRGTIAMSRHPSYVDSATCEFFINVQDNPTLDHQSVEDSTQFGYCVFGEVVAGLEVVERISRVAVGNQGEFTQVPTQPVVIRTVERLK